MIHTDKWEREGLAMEMRGDWRLYLTQSRAHDLFLSIYYLARIKAMQQRDVSSRDQGWQQYQVVTIKIARFYI
jgi:hypothetical protein